MAMGYDHGAGANEYEGSGWTEGCRPAIRAEAGLDEAAGGATVLYPGRKPPFLGVKRPTCPYKNTVQNRFTVENAKGA
jgi:hypothetical protein